MHCEEAVFLEEVEGKRLLEEEVTETRRRMWAWPGGSWVEGGWGWNL